MRRRQPRRERDRQRRRTGWRQAGQGAERAAHGTRVMFVVLIGLAIRVAMAAEHRQQRPFGITDLCVGTAPVCRLERLGEVEGKVEVARYWPLLRTMVSMAGRSPPRHQSLDRRWPLRRAKSCGRTSRRLDLKPPSFSNLHRQPPFRDILALMVRAIANAS